MFCYMPTHKGMCVQAARRCGCLQGTLDGVLCRDTGLQDAEAALRHIHNNLTSPGTYILLTHGPPSLRLPLLNKVQWEIVAVRVIVPARLAVAGAVATSRAKAAAAAASEGLKVVKHDAAAVYPESATYVYICKKPYV